MKFLISTVQLHCTAKFFKRQIGSIRYIFIRCTMETGEANF